MKTRLQIRFLGDPSTDRAPEISVRDGNQERPVALSEKARLVVAYLALEARDPQTVRREDVKQHVLGRYADDDFDRVSRELEVALRDAGAPHVFRPYRRNAADEEREERGTFSLRSNVTCDLAELLTLFGSGDIPTALGHVGDITKRYGACKALPLVKPRTRTRLPVEDRWYTAKRRRLEEFLESHEDDALQAPLALALRPDLERAHDHTAGEGGGQPPVTKRPSRTPRTIRGGVLVALFVVVVAGIAIERSRGKPANGRDPVSCNKTGLSEPSRADREAEKVSPTRSLGTRAERPIVTRSQPRSVAIAAEGVWVAQEGDGSVRLIDPRRSQPVGESIPVGGKPFSLAVANDVLWVTRNDGVLVAVDRKARELRQRSIKYGAGPGEVEVGGGSVWINNFNDQHQGMVTRVNPCTGTLRRIKVGQLSNTVKFAYGALWVSDSKENALHRVDPRTNQVRTTLLETSDPQDVGAGNGYIWVAHYSPGRLSRVNPRSGEVVGKLIPTGKGPAGLAVGGGAVWLPNYLGDSVTRIDLKTLRSEKRAVLVGDSPSGVAVGHGRVWVANFDDEPPSVTPIKP